MPFGHLRWDLFSLRTGDKPEESPYEETYCGPSNIFFVTVRTGDKPEIPYKEIYCGRWNIFSVTVRKLFSKCSQRTLADNTCISNKNGIYVRYRMYISISDIVDRNHCTEKWNR